MTVRSSDISWYYSPPLAKKVDIFHVPENKLPVKAILATSSTHKSPCGSYSDEDCIGEVHDRILLLVGFEPVIFQSIVFWHELLLPRILSLPFPSLGRVRGRRGEDVRWRELGLKQLFCFPYAENQLF
uniref:Uncharacterized protein n=1 Tax=Sphaerodactylus townsendi TaxID=933632 RepID=A0ACB8EHW9_9SAUR